MEAIVKDGGDPDALALLHDPPALALHYPPAVVREAWLEWRDTKRFWDSDQHPLYIDVKLRADVRSWDAFWRYEMAWAKANPQ